MSKESRDEMISCIATWTEKPKSEISNMFHGKSVLEIEPLFNQMKSTRNEMLRERTAIAV